MTGKYDKEIVKNGMLILDCTSETQEKKSEGLLVRELVRILKPKIQPRVVTTRGVSSFIHELKNSSEKLVHISAHGRFYYKKTTRLDFPSGKWITAEEICEALQTRKDKPTLMIFSACSVCNEDLIECLKKVGVKYVIGPEEDVYWFDAAIFLTIFYRLFLVEKHTLWMAYRNTERIRKIFFPQLTGTWLFFENGKLCYSAPYSRNKIGKKVCINYFY